MNRRSFIASILALGCAPAIVRADSLMRIVPREMTVLEEGMPYHLVHGMPDMGYRIGDKITFSDMWPRQTFIVRDVVPGVLAICEPLSRAR